MIWAVVLGGIFIALCFFYYLDQKRKIRKENLHERNKEKFEQLLEQLKHPGEKNRDLHYADKNYRAYTSATQEKLNG